MKLSPTQMQKIVEKIFYVWKENNIVSFKEDEKKVFNRAIQAIKDDIQRELNLEKDAEEMVRDLERKNPGEFQRHKMVQMVKQKLAKERKIIL